MLTDLTRHGLSDAQIRLIRGHESKRTLEVDQYLSPDAVEDAYQEAVLDIALWGSTPSMDTNEVDPEPAAVPPLVTETDVGPLPPVDAPRPSLLRSTWRGAKMGFRWTSYVAGPIAAVGLILILALVAFGVGAGRGWLFVPGWIVPPILLRPFGFYFACGLFGGFLGAVIGLIGGLILLALPGPPSAAWREAANRPIRLLRRRQGAVAPLEATRSRDRRRRWAWLVGVPVLLVLAAAFGTGAYLGRMVDHRLAAAISAADRDDPFWRLADLMAHRDPVPDAENSALVVAEALSLLPENWPAAPPPGPGESKPLPTEAEKAFDRLAATADNVRLDDAVADALRGELDAHDEGVQIARTVAVYDRGRHELQLGPTLIDTPLPETQAARAAARLLAADAAIRAHGGDLDGALDSCRAILGVGRSIGDEPTLISQLVRVAIGEVAMKSACRTLGQGEPSDAALARLQALILDELAQPLLLHGLKGERAIMTELIRRVGAGELPIAAISSGAPPFDPDGPRDVIAPWGKLMFDNQRAVALGWLNEAVAIARRPAASWPPLWEAWDADVDRVKRSWHGPLTATLALLLTPVMSASGTAHSRYQSGLGATAILLAAERHRRKVGDWPASIASIGPGLLPSPPVDPYSGQAFRMERRDGQILVYSIGPDHKDEHGAFDRKQWMKGGPDDVGAVAWDVPRRRQPALPVEALAPAESDRAER
jgi:hypothetical protein